MEVWKVIQQHPKYQVSNLGGMRRLLSNGKVRVLKPFPFKKSEPYLAVDLMQGGVKFRRAVHHLVLETFVGPRPPGMEAIHINGRGGDNKLTNLKWGTKVENQADRVTHGTDCRGEKSPNSKLTESDVDDIIRRRKSKETASSIAKDYPITTDYIYRLSYRMTWKWKK